MKCAICLEERYYIRVTCNNCNIRVHLKCQKQWGSQCIICKKNTGIYTKNKYVYHPPEEEFTQEEIDEQLEIERRIQRQREINEELLAISRNRNRNIIDLVNEMNNNMS